MNTQQQKSSKILLIGDSCKDIYHYGVCERISPEAPVPILRETRIEKKHGMSSNVRSNLLAFGLNVDHFTNKEVIEKHRFIDEIHRQHLLRCDSGEGKKITPFNVKEINEQNDCEIVVISDYDKGFLTHSICKYICKIFSDKVIFVDTKKKDLSCFSNCIIKINEKEFSEVEKKPLL